MSRPRPYANPYHCGVGLGLVLFGAYALAGRGLGASGAFASGASLLVSSADPGRASANAYFAAYLADGGPANDWLVFEIAGVIVGGIASAALSGRTRIGVDRGASVTPRTRLAAAAGGGAIMGVGAMLARGCTSGQALTGGALLSVGSWLFMAALFAAGFGAAQLLKRLWQ
jgi:uncharacterized membrane protein YedE/YeeE